MQAAAIRVAASLLDRADLKSSQSFFRVPPAPLPHHRFDSPPLFLHLFPHNNAALGEQQWTRADNAQLKAKRFKGLRGQVRTAANKRVAEGAGFEPALRFPVNTLSK